MICPYYPTPFLFFFSTEVPALLYYSHLPVFIISIITIIFVLKKDNFSFLSKALALPLFLFNLWLLLDLITWVSNSSDIIMFVWSFLGILFALINFYFFRFLYIFISGKEIPSYLSKVFYILILPIILLTPTALNLTGFDLVLCTSLEGNYFINYYNFIGIIILISSCIFLIKNYKKAEYLNKSKILLMGISTVSFLFLFLITSYIASIFKYFNLVENYQITQYGLFPMIIFIFTLAYLIVRYKIFDIKLVATQVLIWGLSFLIGSQFFFIKSKINFILNGITFIGIIILGNYLIKSVKREVKQRERLEILRLKLEETNIKLEDSNDKLKDLDKLKTEFVSLASHQLRSPLTAIKGYTSMLIEGDYGDINQEAKETIKRVMDSSNNLTLVVEDLLSVSKIEQGGMKYDMAVFDLGDLVENTVKELSITALNRGLKLTYNKTSEQKYLVNGDKEKLRQILVNLIDNSMKYTKEGSIEVSLHRENGKVILSIVDTGVGIAPEVIEHLFEKFSRGDGAKLNSSGSGLGLYLVKKIAEDHHGRVWVKSDGLGKGSTFYVELEESK